jgi:hypothetical protein
VRACWWVFEVPLPLLLSLNPSPPPPPHLHRLRGKEGNKNAIQKTGRLSAFRFPLSAAAKKAVAYLRHPPPPVFFPRPLAKHSTRILSVAHRPPGLPFTSTPPGSPCSKQRRSRCRCRCSWWLLVEGEQRASGAASLPNQSGERPSSKGVCCCVFDKTRQALPGARTTIKPHCQARNCPAAARSLPACTSSFFDP